MTIVFLNNPIPGPKSSMVTAARLLKIQLTGNANAKENGNQIKLHGGQCNCLYETGKRDWYTKTDKKNDLKPVERKQIPDDYKDSTSSRKRLIRISPSEMEETERNAGLLFSIATSDSLELGTAVHELFSRLSWVGEADEVELLREWNNTSTFMEHIKQKAIGQFRQVLAAEELRTALSRPPGNVELWREKHFEIVIGDNWLTGIFDRVVITRGADGTPQNAVILDFKSNDISEEISLPEIAERYRSQLLLYGKALSKILRLDCSQIKLILLFTKPGRIYELEQGTDTA